MNYFIIFILINCVLCSGCSHKKLKENLVMDDNISREAAQPLNPSEIKGEIIELNQLKLLVKEFILNKNNAPNYSLKEQIEIPLLGKQLVSKGYILTNYERGTSYEMFTNVDRELSAAYYEIRDSLSIKHYNKIYIDLNEEKRNSIKMLCPINIISEPVK